MTEIDKPSPSKYLIFEQTQVSLNSDFLSLIPTSVDHTSFFIDIAEELQLTFCEQIDSGGIVFIGMWNNILRAERKLQESLCMWEKERNLNNDKIVEEELRNMENSEEVSILMPDRYSPSLVPGTSNVYLVPNNPPQMQQTQLLTCKRVLENSKQQLSTTQEDSSVNEIHVAIAINSSINNDTSQKYGSKNSPKKDKNPLGKLCQLLRIEEDETIEKSLSLSEKRRSYEENLPYKYFCDKCSFKSKRENHLVKHLKLHEKKNILLHCKECDFRTLCERSLSHHKAVHASKKLTCKLCSFVTVSRVSLRKHTLAKHGPNYAKAVKCSHCDFHANQPRELIQHLKLQHPKLELPQTWKCSKCPYSTKLRAHLNRHMNDIHDCVRKFLCHYCGKEFKRSDTLTAHKAIHGERQRTYQCQHCSKVFIKQVNLQQHLVVHAKERTFLCDNCGKSYKTLEAVKRHKRFMHSKDVRILLCPRNCERKFKYPAHLSRHLKQPCKKSRRLKSQELEVTQVTETTQMPVTTSVPEATLVPLTTVKQETTPQVFEVINSNFVKEEVVTTPFTIQVVYKEALLTDNQDVINK